MVQIKKGRKEERNAEIKMKNKEAKYKTKKIMKGRLDN